MMPGPRGASGDTRRAKNAGATFKRLLGYLTEHRVRIIGALILTLLSTTFGVVQPTITGFITTDLYNGVATGTFDWNHVTQMLLVLAGSYIVAQLFAFLQGNIMNTLTAKVLQGLRNEIDEKVHRLPLNYYDMRSSGEILSVITNDVDMVNAALSGNLTQIVSQVATALGIFIMMLRLNGWLTLIAVLMVPVSLLASMGVIKASGKWAAAQQAQLGDLNGYIEELYEGQNIVQSFNYQARATARFDELNHQLEDSARRASRNSGMVRPIASSITNFGYALSAALGCLFALNGTISVGDVQAMLQYTRQFSQPFTQIAAMAGSLMAAIAAAERIFELLDAEEEVPDPAQGTVPASRDGSVEFEHVVFGYTPGNTLMHDVTFAAKPGQKVAIVGPTGAGKTTLINLLMRFYEINGGAISVDRTQTKEMTRQELRQRFGMVLQDTWLFQGTIRENLAYGKDGATDEEIVAAAKAASVDSIIRTLPGGYDMLLTAGAENISQGERQLLTIARAIVADPEIMILDEATSNVDTRTEAVIQRAMNELMNGRTSFVIAHRLSTIRDADQILYMEHGDILEVGTHEELMAKHGKYEQLYLSQFG